MMRTTGPTIVGSTIMAIAMAASTGAASAASIKTDWHASLTSDRSRLDSEGTIYNPTLDSKSHNDPIEVRVY
jgi:hypothetical protein